MVLSRFEKAPVEVLDYYIQWGSFLGGDPITVSLWSTTGTVTLDRETFGDSLTGIWATGGTQGELVDMVNDIETQAGRKLRGILRLVITD